MCLPVCFPTRPGIYSKRKEFASKGSKFFPFRADPFQRGGKNNFTEFDRAVSPEKVSIPLKKHKDLPEKTV